MAEQALVRNLVFEGIPDEQVAAFAEGVIATLDKLGYDFEFDDTGPPNSEGCTTYMIHDVRLKPEEVTIKTSDVGEMPKGLLG